MISDQTTFFLSFLTVFLALGWYLWHLERKVDALTARLQTPATSEKNDDRSRSP